MTPSIAILRITDETDILKKEIEKSVQQIEILN